MIIGGGWRTTLPASTMSWFEASAGTRSAPAVAAITRPGTHPPSTGGAPRERLRSPRTSAGLAAVRSEPRKLPRAWAVAGSAFGGRRSRDPREAPLSEWRRRRPRVAVLPVARDAMRRRASARSVLLARATCPPRVDGLPAECRRDVSDGRGARILPRVPGRRRSDEGEVSGR